MAKKGKKIQGIEAFNEYYAAAWGERWDQLKAALLGPKHYCGLTHPHFPQELEGFEMIVPDAHLLPRSIQGHHYSLDPASAISVDQLGVVPGQEVLDLCAAPGGKSIIILKRLHLQGRLVANDRSRDRRERLKRNLEEFLPRNSQISLNITGHDASSWCLHEKDAYDCILLDAPCSSERHVLESPEHLSQWSKGRTERLSKDQFTMLVSALDVVKVGGRILYSTCSISPLENEEIIKKLIKKRAGRVKIIQSTDAYSEKNEYGNYLLPDKSLFGPIFFCLIERVS
ncbi:MAG: SAM-dependent methyltransferase [Bacteriovoracaceae bacterium]